MEIEERLNYEYFSKVWKIWKPVLITDCIESLKKCGYKIRRKGVMRELKELMDVLKDITPSEREALFAKHGDLISKDFNIDIVNRPYTDVMKLENPSIVCMDKFKNIMYLKEFIPKKKKQT